jgi:hypothetical protein
MHLAATELVVVEEPKGRYTFPFAIVAVLSVRG